MAAEGARVVANFSESTTSPRRSAKALKQARALELRIAGWRYDAIAAELGYAHRGNAQKLVSAALDDLASKTTESAEQMRTLETERLTAAVADADAILRRPEASDSNRLRALELKIRASESLRKLWGLDAPAALDLTSGGAALPSMPELIAALRAADQVGLDHNTDHS